MGNFVRRIVFLKNMLIFRFILFKDYKKFVMLNVCLQNTIQILPLLWLLLFNLLLTRDGCKSCISFQKVSFISLFDFVADLTQEPILTPQMGQTRFASCTLDSKHEMQILWLHGNVTGFTKTVRHNGQSTSSTDNFFSKLFTLTPRLGAMFPKEQMLSLSLA